MFSVSNKCISSSMIPREISEILPERLVSDIVRIVSPFGESARLEEIRLRCERCASIVVNGRNYRLQTVLLRGEMQNLLTAFCGGSLYAYSDTINQGFITLPSGIRVGICGRASCEDGHVIGVYDISAMSLRIPHKHTGVGGKLANLIRCGGSRGLLIWSPPGVGKTTLLRGVAAELAGGETPLRVAVIDTRGELSFSCDSSDLCIDVLSGYPRKLGVEIAARTMNSQVIICDEIGDYDEAFALISAGNCGIPLVASAHAGNIRELLNRTGIRILHESMIFSAYVGISRNGSGGFRYDIQTWEAANDSL